MLELTIQGLNLRLQTEPGLFSPRGADAGTLAMLSLIEFSPDDKVLDLGCGYGLVGIVAAKHVSPAQVHLLDNDPRAVETARANAVRNGVPDVTLELSDGFKSTREMDFTKIISNPPYHVDFSVPRHFIEKGFNRLRIGGSMWMVTRRLDWYRNKLIAIFGGCRVHEVDGYFVFEATKLRSQYAHAR
ncbi:class I SAM-dependent methyltransferase [Devosia nitrariae]|uniref:16S RNA G1207 methylase RsmC n=1 Tax=Devosia nitrariae TaxID=2071872 RepID=A0ABQ5WAM7_9HYPH|nr:methyltransferase [Devosia nitrariae]GLQ57170.1 16S RNA G1207 methylase RsmC [Devosia nitrariae]